jgi:outer membrane protein assembly factor BamB
MFSLAADSGQTNWTAPVADGIHYQSTSAADGVVWTVDSQANLDGFDAATGQALVRRPLSVDAGVPIVNNTSSGIAIAEHELFVAAGGGGYASTTGYLVAYRAGP